jgi:OmcA/MtrC family decaheme c-type cytochrome
MIHKMHVNGLAYNVDGRDYTSVHYPQPVSNCLTCHDNNRMPKPAGRLAADAVAFQERPSAEACGTCHNINFTTGSFSHLFGNAPASDCLTCHGPGTTIAPLTAYHNDFYSTPNNPVVAEDFYVFEWQIASVVLNASLQPQVKFRLLADGVPMVLNALPTGVTGLGNLAFRLVYSMPQGDSVSGPAIPAPIDWNNRGGGSRLYYDLATPLVDGNSYDQPVNRSLSNAITAVGFSGPDAEGYYTTAFGIGTTPAAFPAGSLLRAIGFEGYPNTPGPALPENEGANISGRTILVGIGENAPKPRRVIADIEKCDACHERLGFHSNSSRRGDVDYCATCHNPEMSSSNVFSGLLPEPRAFDTPVSAQLSMNLKDLVHATHAGKPVGGDPIREIPFAFIRGTVAGGSGQGPYDFSDIGYPAKLADCETCHLPDTYKLPVDSGALWTVVDAVPALAGNAAAYAPELAERQGPTAASCYGCHNSAAIKTHLDLNTTSTGEACSVCHGSGKIVPGHD